MAASLVPQSSAGTTFELSAVLPATYDPSGYAAVTGWQTVAHVNDLGDFGADATLITYTSLGQRIKGKLKGSIDQGSSSVSLHRVISGAGQALMRTAQASDLSYSFRVTIQDGTKFYFTGKVMSFITKVGGVDNILGATAKLEIDSATVEV
jgi:hypothetical protein